MASYCIHPLCFVCAPVIGSSAQAQTTVLLSHANSPMTSSLVCRCHSGQDPFRCKAGLVSVWFRNKADVLCITEHCALVVVQFGSVQEYCCHQMRLHFLRILRKSNISLVCFSLSTMAGILAYCTVANRKEWLRRCPVSLPSGGPSWFLLSRESQHDCEGLISPRPLPV